MSLSLHVPVTVVRIYIFQRAVVAVVFRLPLIFARDELQITGSDDAGLLYIWVFQTTFTGYKWLIWAMLIGREGRNRQHKMTVKMTMAEFLKHCRMKGRRLFLAQFQPLRTIDESWIIIRGGIVPLAPLYCRVLTQQNAWIAKALRATITYLCSLLLKRLPQVVGMSVLSLVSV